ncbi:MAG TPA: hypothetical protein VED17_09815 [Nitrososphaerales archaeon]|nr:hypothetical protein [Nitrososphaerales archaeon]
MSNKKKSEDPKQLSTLVSLLDGYAALSVSDPARIRKIAKSYSEDDPDIRSAWREISKDVDDISELASTSDDIVKQSRRLGIIRPFMLFLPLFVLTIYYALVGFHVIAHLGQLGAYAFLGIFIAAYVLSFILYISMNKKLSRTVNSYYDQHMGEIARQRRHIKIVNQRFIDRLAMIIRSENRDPDKYKFSLFHNDYTNINVVSEDKNSIYTVTVKGKSIRKEQ